ncbi:MAG: phosphoribosyltransferase domain-containing protein [Gammaproteobacteria bacterium]
MTQQLSIPLATGTLHLEIEPGRVPIRRLLGFASRIGSKRKFLLVSKVLGKHYPVSPLLMRWSYRALARSVLKTGLGQGSLWIGMAETATGLGYGVFESAFLEGMQNGLFLQTTRYHLEGLPRLEFDEAHSHATDFFLYYPTDAEKLKLFSSAEALVLIDDEISTGRTFLRLIQAYQAVNPGLRQVFIVSLVNFAGLEDRAKLEDQAGVPVAWVALREGRLRFEAAGAETVAPMPVNVIGNGRCKKHLLAWSGRQGMTAPVRLADADMLALQALLQSPEQGPLLVLGTGECNAPAYLLGSELERRGYRVKVQSTTRSPIHPGNDIASVCRFQDNYDDGIDNFIYNVNPASYQTIILCHETPLSQPLLERLDAWRAISAGITHDSSTGHAKLHFSRPG